MKSEKDRNLKNVSYCKGIEVEREHELRKRKRKRLIRKCEKLQKRDY